MVASETRFMNSVLLKINRARNGIELLLYVKFELLIDITADTESIQWTVCTQEQINGVRRRRNKPTFSTTECKPKGKFLSPYRYYV